MSHAIRTVWCLICMISVTYKRLTALGFPHGRSRVGQQVFGRRRYHPVPTSRMRRRTDLSRGDQSPRATRVKPDFLARTTNRRRRSAVASLCHWSRRQPDFPVAGTIRIRLKIFFRGPREPIRQHHISSILCIGSRSYHRAVSLTVPRLSAALPVRGRRTLARQVPGSGIRDCPADATENVTTWRLRNPPRALMRGRQGRRKAKHPWHLTSLTTPARPHPTG